MRIQQRILELIRQHGGLRKASAVLRVDAGYLSRLLAGAKTNPGKPLLRRMGIRAKEIVYERIKPT